MGTALGSVCLDSSMTTFVNSYFKPVCSVTWANFCITKPSCFIFPVLLLDSYREIHYIEQLLLNLLHLPPIWPQFSFYVLIDQGEKDLCSD
jgi:hypothetical protein